MPLLVPPIVVCELHPCAAGHDAVVKDDGDGQALPL